MKLPTLLGFAAAISLLCGLPADAQNGQIGSFQPNSANAAQTTATTSSAPIRLPGGVAVLVQNVGSTNGLYVRLGTSNAVTATSKDIYIGPSSGCVVSVGSNTYIGLLSAASTTAVNLNGGSGLGSCPTGGGGGSGGGGGGAVTMASGAVASGAYSAGSIAAGALVSGADITEGGLSDSPACTTASASVDACLKQIDADVKGTGNIQGVTASGATSTENPIANGCLAKTATPTAVTDGQKVEGLCDALGRSVTSPWSVPANYVSGTGNTTSTGATTIIAAPGASIKLYITSLQCFRTDAGTSLDYAVLDDAASTPIPIPTGTGAAVQFATPLVVTANTALTFAPHTGATTEFCNAQGYKGP